MGSSLLDAMSDPGYSRDEMLRDYQREKSRFVAAVQAKAADGGTPSGDAVPYAGSGGDTGSAGWQAAPSFSGGQSNSAGSGVVDAANVDAVRQLPPVVITGRKMTELEKAVYGLENWGDTYTADVNKYWDDQNDGSRSGAGFLGNHFGSLLGQAGTGIVRGGIGLVRLATDPRAQINTLRTVGGALAHPVDTVGSLYQEGRAFAAKPLGEQAGSVLKFGVETLATLGVGKVAMLAGDVVVANSMRAVDSLGSATESLAAGRWGPSTRFDGDAGAVGSARGAEVSFGAGTRALGGEVTTIPRNGSRLVLDQSYVSDIGNVACGPTSCAMVMNDRGQFVNISHLAQDAGLVPGVGTDVLGLSDALRQHGLSTARASFGTTIDDLAASTANGNAAIAHVSLTGDAGHFVVVDGVTTRMGNFLSRSTSSRPSSLARLY